MSLNPLNKKKIPQSSQIKEKSKPEKDWFMLFSLFSLTILIGALVVFLIFKIT